jgi:predicted enzyme related to lactoylglutathione lyase
MGIPRNVTRMANHIAHFHFDAEDLARARRFYETVFGWRFRAWGPPEYFLIEAGDAGIHGSMARRPRGHAAGDGGFECTIAVEDIEATARAVTAAGGQITIPKNVIHGVGEHIQFRDTEGNTVAAMRYF